ncbi:MAG: hypothetical protein Q7R65_03675 [bacterium]|nr:hypothetical protein [bacterium]
MKKLYTQHEGRIVNTDTRFAHVMAITLDPRTNYREGIIRCITIRDGDVAVKGFTDRSELHKVIGDSLEHFKIGERLFIKNESEVITGLTEKGFEFIGLEDPDIWIDEETNLMHVYFTIPIKPIGKNLDKSKKIKIHLGHAVGKGLDSLEMTEPILMDTGGMSAKEVSIAPLNKKGFRYNLVESGDRIDDTTYSVVRVAIAEDMGKAWQYGELAFHPAEEKIPWIGGHASPGPLFPETFINVGEGKRLGVMNGREANQIVAGKTLYGMFSVGLFIYDYENGKIEWVSPEPFIQDSEAKTITFASQFVETEKGQGILYAHVDDSFVRAYTLNVDLIKPLLP